MMTVVGLALKKVLYRMVLLESSGRNAWLTHAYLA